MKETELENERYLKAQAQKYKEYKEQQEMKRKEEEKAAAEGFSFVPPPSPRMSSMQQECLNFLSALNGP